jgi:hypothetical protein
VPANRIEELKAAAATQARKKVADDLGVNVGDLSPELKKAVSDSVDRQFRANVETRAVNSAVNNVLKKDAIGPALRNLNAVQVATVALPELGVALQKNAELLFKTYKAFSDAGFTEEQAFQIVLTQIQR